MGCVEVGEVRPIFMADAAFRNVKVDVAAHIVPIEIVLQPAECLSLTHMST